MAEFNTMTSGEILFMIVTRFSSFSCSAKLDYEAGSREKHKSNAFHHSRTSNGGERATSGCGCGETKKEAVKPAKKKKK